MEHRHEGRRILVRFDVGEEIVSGLTELCHTHGVGCASLSGIGAVREAQVGYFDVRTLDYRIRNIREVCELVSLIGNVALYEGEPLVHAHVGLAKGDLELLGGHLFTATVAAAVEVFLDVWETPVVREFDPQLKLKLLAHLE